MYMNEEKMLLSFKVLDVIYSKNSPRFEEFLDDLHPKTIILGRYADKQDDNYKDIVQEFYGMSVDGWFSSRKNVKMFLFEDK